LIATQDPSVAVGHLCTPFKVEMVIRGYLSGHAAREYALGKEICGVPMPEGLKEMINSQPPLLRRQQKRIMGTRCRYLKREHLSKGIVSEEDYLVLEKYTRALFQRGTEIAAVLD
jgi:phosphoribosylaminoimidazole-succinocarboxamide synthase